jgi:four helix bundle protein
MGYEAIYLLLGYRLVQRRCEYLSEVNRMAQSFRQLIAWQKAMELVTEIYRVTKNFPCDEAYGLTSQLRRAAVSVPSNIAEGQARYSRREFYRFLTVARGSLAEIETQVTIAKSLDYLTSATADLLLSRSAEPGRILNGLITSTKSAA